MNKLQIIEHENQRVLTTQQLAEVYKTEANNIHKNYTNNKERFTPGKDFYFIQGKELQEFKRVLNGIHDPLKFTSQLYLWTERGANRHCKILDTDMAWQQFDILEENYFRIKSQAPACIEDLIIMQAQAMKEMRTDLNILKSESKQINGTIKDIRETISIIPGQDWRQKTNKIMQAIGFKANGNYNQIKLQVYEAVKQRASVNLTQRLNNLMTRALKNGMAPSKVKQLNTLDVIGEDKKLIEIYTTIVKEMAIKHGIST